MPYKPQYTLKHNKTVNTTFTPFCNIVTGKTNEHLDEMCFDLPTAGYD